jgi:translation initiation factor 1
MWENAPMPSPTDSPLLLRFEKAGRGGKAVTILTGLRLHPEGKNALLADLKKRLGAGGTVKDGALELQGDQRERLLPLLTALGFRVARGH